jgi:hypothetical protein
MAEWFDDENFWKKLYPFLFAPELFEKAEEEVEKILNLTSFRGDSVWTSAAARGGMRSSWPSEDYL